MKTLLVMRHTKASWKDQKLKDRERPLTKRGKKDALQMGQRIMEEELLPQVIYCSAAVRARETAEGVVSGCHYSGEVIYLDHLFAADWDLILDALRLLPDNLERSLIIGHNPGLEGLVQRLGGKVLTLPLGGVACLYLAVDCWRDIDKHTRAESVQVWAPVEVESEIKS